MQKARLITLEQAFVLIAISIIFVVTFHQMSTDGVLPGNDPAIHLLEAKTIVMNERVTYSEVLSYPPLFHAILAVLQIFAGTLDVMVAAFILKLLMATLNALLLLSTYLLSRKLLGIDIAVISTIFTILSVPLLEMIFWGGYANFLGLAYIAFIFYIMILDFQFTIKTFLLVLGTLTLVLSHELSAFVFVLMFVPAYLIKTIGSRRKFIVFLVVIVGGGLALLAWYARIFVQYSSILIEHIFFMMTENVYHIPLVGLGFLTENLGVTLYLALAGILLTFFLLRKKKIPKSSILIVFWGAVPFLLSQSFLFGISLPYHRFIYFFATPITILAAIATYNLTKLPAFVESKLVSEIARKRKILRASKVIVVALIFTMFLIQSFVFFQRIDAYPQFYERGSIPSYDSGLWVKQHSVSDGTVVVPRSPGSWFSVFSDRYTIQETDPLYLRNAVAETVLYSFYEMENSFYESGSGTFRARAYATNISGTLTREYPPESSRSGQEMYVSRYNVWTKALSIPNDEIKVIYAKAIHANILGGNVTIPLSETVESVYWNQTSADESQLVSEYVHELFTVEKVVTFSSNRSVIDIDFRIQAHQDLPLVKLEFAGYMAPSLDYKEALVPGVLNWENPWDAAAREPHDNASYFNPLREWAVVQGSLELLDDSVMAVLDAKNGVLTAFELDGLPDWFILGALDNHFIDALRLGYELGSLDDRDKGEVSLSVLTYAFESEEIERWTASYLHRLFDMKVDLPVQERDFLTYIEDYNIKFVVVDTQQVPSNVMPSPALDKVYNNGRIIVYTTKR